MPAYATENPHASNAFKFWPHGVVVILIVLLITLCGFFLFKRYKPSREEQGFFPPDEVERRQDGSDEQSA
ncbi:unnamed protein product [Cyprideis torosa]|uniref:Uncharacterized protein n=1 Tax=Cyprideis torosa TaxID=163714 RepID=A0A7R8ZHW9_9CRUS|nr:unnamed protein product [Cyprideis torosa]CAG0884746.1 unnamed protein product [Cyprideis torosa]